MHSILNPGKRARCWAHCVPGLSIVGMKRRPYMTALSQTGQWRKMISSQSSAQPAAALSSETETGTKRIVTSQGFCSRRDPPRSQLETEPRPLKNPTERKYSFL